MKNLPSGRTHGRASFLVATVPALLGLACGSTLTPPEAPATKQAEHQLAAARVADPCASATTADACQAAGAACAWTAVACPADADCPPAVCATIDPCAAHNDASACGTDSRCAWTALAGTATAPALCPVGHDCTLGGYCWEAPRAGSGCGCVQPLACPKDGACPAVSCDCPPLPVRDAGGSRAGGGTCTCACLACAPGETCPPCACDCDTGGGGTGGTGGGGAGGGGVCGTTTGAGNTTGSGTCTCACPSCPTGAACAPCSCSCGGSATTTMTVGMGSTAPPDACAAFTDARSCAADAADGCAWVQLQIACFTTPCPTGQCVRMSPPADGGAATGTGACGCGCPACTAGAACPPCKCDCCPAAVPAWGPTASTGPGTPTAPQPVTAGHLQGPGDYPAGAATIASRRH